MSQGKIFVNGYGATRNPKDRNYTHYLDEVSRFIRRDPKTEFTVYLCGGYTNRIDLTEAECMRRIWELRGIPQNVSLVLIEKTTTARDNLQAVRLAGDEPITVFCELSRKPTMWFLASRLFSSVQVVGIGFDEKSLAIGHRLKQLFLKFPLEALAYYSPLFDKLRVILRERHVADARRQEK